LFALITVIIVAALLALWQINAQRSGVDSPLTQAGMTAAVLFESATSATIGGVRYATGAVLSVPSLERDNRALREQNRSLQTENVRLHELAAQYAAESRVQQTVDTAPNGVEARVIGFPPENESRTVTINKGASAGIRKDDGVLADGGVVGLITSVQPFSSQVMLITDYTSRLPAITRHGRFWGIARGNLATVRVEYIPQDAPIRVGDIVVTGEGRSFHSGIPIGTIAKIERADTTLYQTAILKPAVDLGAIDHVVVVPK
jgi:rod shape-determining protein MreC